MYLYMYVEADELEEFVEPISASISEWIDADDELTHLVNQPENSWLGIDVAITKQHQLKKPLNFLYSLAKEHKCNFVIGIISPDNREDICYFGHEEGRPDMYEVATYLEL